MSINRIKWQAKLFSPKDSVKRASLVNMQPDWPTKVVKIKVFRNESGVFESVSDVLRVYLQYMGLTPEYSYSAFDSSMAWDLYDEPYDYALFFLSEVESSKFTEDKFTKFCERIKGLKDRGVPHSVILGFKEKKDYSYNFYRIYKSVLNESEASDIDGSSNFKMEVGSVLYAKNALQRIIWRDTASEIYSKLMPRVKAIITDLDGTLQDGVLAEPDPEEPYFWETLEKDNAFRNVRIILKDHYQQRGIMLNMISRNEVADIEDRFFIDELSTASNSSFKRSEFAIVKANWENKSDGIKAICAELNISTDDVVFLDDNVGVLAEVAEALPNTRIIWQDKLSVETALVVGGLSYNYQMDEAATLRVADISANFARKEGMEKIDRFEYLRSLDMNIDVRLNNKEDIDRILELELKTNQFNFNFTRFNKIQLENYINSGGQFAAFELMDLLSDSGMIGYILFQQHDQRVTIDNIVLSCRALGRNVEDVVLHNFIDYLYSIYNKTIFIHFKSGPKNKPAKNWLQNLIGSDIEDGAHQILRNEKAKNEWNFKLGAYLKWI